MRLPAQVFQVTPKTLLSILVREKCDQFMRSLNTENHKLRDKDTATVTVFKMTSADLKFRICADNSRATDMYH